MISNDLFQNYKYQIKLWLIEDELLDDEFEEEGNMDDDTSKEYDFLWDLIGDSPCLEE